MKTLMSMREKKKVDVMMNKEQHCLLATWSKLNGVQKVNGTKQTEPRQLYFKMISV